jgi:hypothetical protein
MDATFERRLRAAVSAGWRVLVAEVAFLALVWGIYVSIEGAHPSAMLALWGPDVTWSTVATISLQAIAACKVVIWLQVALLAWAWLWASTLRKLGADNAEPRIESAPEHAPDTRRKPVSAAAATRARRHGRCFSMPLPRGQPWQRAALPSKST